MMQIAVRFCRFLALLGTLTVPGLAAAAQPEPWQMNLQDPATPLMGTDREFSRSITDRHHADLAVRAGASGLRGHEVQRESEPKS